MSRVTFHSPSGEAELRGGERAYAADALYCDLAEALGLPRDYRPEGA